MAVYIVVVIGTIFTFRMDTHSPPTTKHETTEKNENETKCTQQSEQPNERTKFHKTALKHTLHEQKHP